MSNLRSSIFDVRCPIFNRRSQIAHGFTLVELLVVVAIIALLMAVLLPSLNKARASARSVVCMTNLHQIGVAVYSYAADNNDAAAPYQWTNDKHDDGGQPPGYVGQYCYYIAYSSDSIFLGQYTDPQFGNAVNGRQINGRVQARSVWRCPEDRSKTSDGWYEASYSEYSYAYPMGTDIGSSTQWGQNGHTNTHWKVGSAKAPARMLSFVDCSGKRFDCGLNFYGNIDGQTISGNEYKPGWPGCYYNHSIRHPSYSTNVLFLDGHIQTLRNEPNGADWSLSPAYQRGEFVLLRDQS